MSFLKNEKGQALVIMTICMSILIGMAGMAIDIGLLYRTRQNLQIAADAAAEAAALDYHYNKSITAAQLKGQAASTSNGFTDGVSGASVVINMPPNSGAVSGNTNYAEALVTYPNPVSFMGLFGHPTVSVTARGVAGPSSPGTACGWLTGTSGTDMTLQGSYNIDTPGCGWYVYSNDTNAIKVTGNGGTFTAKFIDVVGNVTPKFQTTPTPITPNATMRNPPIDPPDAGSCNVTIDPTKLTTAGVLTQTDVTTLIGTDPVATSEVVCFSSAVTLSNGVNLPGNSSGGILYVFNGVTIPTNSTVNVGSCPSCTLTSTPPIFTDSDNGATVYLQSGGLTEASSSVLSVFAPTTGTYNGVAIMESSTNSTTLQIQFGSNNQVLDGYIYAPNAELDLHDSGGGVTATGIIAKTMVAQTSQLTIPSYDDFHLDTTPNPIITLVE